MSTVTLIDRDGTVRHTEVPYVGADILTIEEEFHFVDFPNAPRTRRRYTLCQCPAWEGFHYHEDEA
jgi:hypothetical protein